MVNGIGYEEAYGYRDPVCPFHRFYLGMDRGILGKKENKPQQGYFSAKLMAITPFLAGAAHRNGGCPQAMLLACRREPWQQLQRSLWLNPDA